MNHYNKYLKYKNKYLKYKSQMGGMIEETFTYNDKTITADVFEDFICPISSEVMNDPVIISDGHSYERAVITQWLRDHNTSPKTGEQLRNKNIITNYAIKGVIDEFKKNIYDIKLNEQIGELRRRVEENDSIAILKLGLMYKDGIGLVIIDYTKAKEYFEKALELGNNDGLANLGLLYQNGFLIANEALNNATNFASTKLTIGYLDQGSITLPFSGSITQTSVYNIQLSAEEVLQNFNAQKSRYGI